MFASACVCVCVFTILMVRIEEIFLSKTIVVISSELSAITLNPMINASYFLNTLYRPQTYSSIYQLSDIQLTFGLANLRAIHREYIINIAKRSKIKDSQKVHCFL